MWFKQTQIFQLPAIPYDPAKLATQLETLIFTPCLPSLPTSAGWVPPLEADDEEIPLVHGINNSMLICLQFEEKILPAVVVRQELVKKIKEIELQYGRKVTPKQKYVLKEEIIQTLLPRAFSKFSRVYAYIDTKHNWLIIDTNSAQRVEKFIELFSKSLQLKEIQPLTKKLAATLTHWLVQQNYPQSFSIEKACVLRDPNKQNRIIRCQQQDLSANPIQLIIKDGCEVSQLALAWNDHIHFTLTDDFSLRSIKYQDEVIAQAQELEPETQRQQFETDFLIMSESLSRLLKDLTEIFFPSAATKIENADEKLLYLTTA